MKISMLDHLNLSVLNFDETVDWYGKVFGFELMEEGVRDGVRWGTIQSGDALICIYEKPGHELLNSEITEPNEKIGVNHWGFRIEDENKWLDTIKKYDIDVKYGGVVPWNHSKSWYVFDPSGYEIEVAKWKNNKPRFS